MKIRKFNESTEDNNDISVDRVGEIMNDLKKTASLLHNENKTIEGYLNELGNFKSTSEKGNDQIDDSILAFQVIRENLLDSIEKTDTVINNLIDYNDNGRNFLYTEK